MGLNSIQAADLFRDAILAALGYAPQRIIGDGEIHRFSTSKSKLDDAGWYLFHDDDFPAGEFGDWRTCEQQSWHANGARKLTKANRSRIKEVEAGAKGSGRLGMRRRHARRKRFGKERAPRARITLILSRKALSRMGRGRTARASCLYLFVPTARLRQSRRLPPMAASSS